MIEKKGIAEALNLPTSEQLQNLTGNNYPDLYEKDEDNNELTKNELTLEEAKNAMDTLKSMRLQLKDIPDITSRKSLLDKLAEKAEEKFNDIFDRAFNCEDRYASEMLNSATAILKIALDAHAKVIDSDIKLIDLQIKKDKIEIELNQKNIDNSSQNTTTSTENESVILMNRNQRLTNKISNK